MTSKNNLEKIILALDVSDLEAAKQILEKTKNDFSIYKIGMELFYAHGAIAINLVRSFGKKIFLDLKLHDIDNTMLKSLEALNNLYAKESNDLQFLSIHLQAPLFTEKRTELTKKLTVIKNLNFNLVGISVLTAHSLEGLKNIFGAQFDFENHLKKLASFATQHHIKYLVCSPLEVPFFKKHFPSLKLITPGIRLKSGQTHDQERITTPRIALESGADYLVMGRALFEGDYFLNLQDLIQNIDKI